MAFLFQSEGYQHLSSEWGGVGKQKRGVKNEKEESVEGMKSCQENTVS